MNWADLKDEALKYLAVIILTFGVTQISKIADTNVDLAQRILLHDEKVKEHDAEIESLRVETKEHSVSIVEHDEKIKNNTYRLDQQRDKIVELDRANNRQDVDIARLSSK
jgi:hypothetical protein